MSLSEVQKHILHLVDTTNSSVHSKNKIQFLLYLSQQGGLDSDYISVETQTDIDFDTTIRIPHSEQVNSELENLIEKDYIQETNQSYTVTDKGKKQVDSYTLPLQESRAITQVKMKYNDTSVPELARKLSL